jgi:hypothetical protein
LTDEANQMQLLAELPVKPNTLTGKVDAFSRL